jgi:thioester reductase-like protein
MATSHPKIIPLSVDLSKPHFNLSNSPFEDLKLETTHIIHCAWEINFSLSIRSFEPQIQALHNLLTMSMDKPEPAHLIICSSVGTAMAAPTPALVPPAQIPDLHQASATGYARSKLVGEHVVEAATKLSVNATILRIGQIVPARNIGSQLWNPNKAITLMIRTARTLGVLPGALNRKGTDSCTWLEADTLARAVMELSGIEREISIAYGLKVYNIVNPRPFSWKLEMIPALKAAGFDFEVVEFSVWLERLRAETDPEKNPSRKLLEFWEEHEDAEVGKGGEVIFETNQAEELSEALRRAKMVVDGDMVDRLIKAWQKACRISNVLKPKLRPHGS